MKNQEVSDMLNEIADYLEFEDDAKFKVRAYRRAALSVASLTEDIAQMAVQRRLREIPGVGEAIAETISQFLSAGTVPYLSELKKRTPVDVEALGKIGGVGPKTMVKLYRELGIQNVKSLEKAAKEGKIEGIKGFGKTVQSNLLRGIEFSRKSSERISIGVALPVAEEIVRRLKELKEVKQAVIAGSLRRMKETIGDIDILVTSPHPGKVIKMFTSMKEVAGVLAQGDTKSSVVLDSGLQVDVRVLDDAVFGAGLLYFSGGKEHNVALRRVAIAKELKLSEYGLVDTKGKVYTGKSEEEIYRKLGLQYIPPELREEGDEIEAAQKNNIPSLIELKDIRGDLQIQTIWSDGANSIEEYARAAQEIGYEYICITDHVGKLAVAHALNERRLKEQRKEIEKLNDKLQGIRILQGCEVNIDAKGKLDMPDSVLKELDIVLAAIHSGFKNDAGHIMKRLTGAMENEHVDIIAHPSGRIIGKREPYELDIQALIEGAKRTGTILEIDAFPNRLDLKDTHAKSAVKAGVKLAIDTDSHAVEHLSLMKYGVGTARRGWASAKNVINTYRLKEMLKCLK